MSRWPTYPCACSFAKTVDDKDPTAFPRIGMADNVLYRGYWIIKHSMTDAEAIICDPKRGPLHAEARDCCWDWFDTTGLTPKERSQDTA